MTFISIHGYLIISCFTFLCVHIGCIFFLNIRQCLLHFSFLSFQDKQSFPPSFYIYIKQGNKNSSGLDDELETQDSVKDSA